MRRCSQYSMASKMAPISRLLSSSGARGTTILGGPLAFTCCGCSHFSFLPSYPGQTTPLAWHFRHPGRVESHTSRRRRQSQHCLALDPSMFCRGDQKRWPGGNSGSDHQLFLTRIVAVPMWMFGLCIHGVSRLTRDTWTQRPQLIAKPANHLVQSQMIGIETK